MWSIWLAAIWNIWARSPALDCEASKDLPRPANLSSYAGHLSRYDSDDLVAEAIQACMEPCRAIFTVRSSS